MKAQQRILYFDYLKVLAIFLVVFCHRPWLDSTVSSNVCMLLATTTAVPIFFMINGALLFGRELSIKKHYIKTLHFFLIMFLWRVVYLLLSAANKMVDLSTLSLTDLINYFCGVLIKEVPTGHLWFVNALIFCYLLFPLLKIAYDHSKRLFAYIAIYCFVGSQLTEEIEFFMNYFHDNYNTPVFNISNLRNAIFPFGQYGNILFYFIIGILVHNHFFVKKKRVPMQTPVIAILFTLGLFWLFIEKYMQCGAFIWTGVTFSNAYKKIGAVMTSISLFILFASTDIKENKAYRLINYLGKRTLDVYYIHMFIAALFLQYLFPKFHMDGVLYNSLRALIIMGLSLFIGWVIRSMPHAKKMLT